MHIKLTLDIDEMMKYDLGTIHMYVSVRQVFTISDIPKFMGEADLMISRSLHKDNYR